MQLALNRAERQQRTQDSVAAAITKGGTDVAGLIFQAILALSLATVLGLLVWLLISVFADAIPYLNERGLVPFLSDNLSSKVEKYGISQAIMGSLIILAFVAVFAFPLGVASAIYLEEYAPDNRATRLLNLVIRNLAGVPSVVYGILGLVVFKELLGTPARGANGRLLEPAWWQFTGGASLISAGLTMAILVLPIVTITSAEAIRAVPAPLREAGFGVGATRSEVIRHHVLPFAAPGILTGTILAFARAIGEAAPLLMVGAVTGLLATPHGLVDTLTSKFTALPMVIFAGLRKPATANWPGVVAATILILIVILVIANGLAIVLRDRFERRRSGQSTKRRAR